MVAPSAQYGIGKYGESSYSVLASTPLDSNYDIKAIVSQTIFSSSKIKKAGQEGSLTSDYQIHKLTSAINSNADIKKINNQHNIFSQSKIKKLGNQHNIFSQADKKKSASSVINMNYWIKKTYRTCPISAIYGSGLYGYSYYGIECVCCFLNSDAWISVQAKVTIPCDAKIKKLGNSHSINCNSHIVLPSGSIFSNYDIKQEYQKTITSDSNVTPHHVISINCMYYIKQNYFATLNSNNDIKQTYAVSLTSDYNISGIISIPSNSYIKQTYANYINCGGYISIRYYKLINQDAHIKKISLPTITSDYEIKTTSLPSITQNAEITKIARGILYSPPNGSSYYIQSYYQWYIPLTYLGLIHIEFEIATTPLFADADIVKHEYSWRPHVLYPWSYWDGAIWQPYPTAGLPPSEAEQDHFARIWMPDLDAGIYYWRIRGVVK